MRHARPPAHTQLAKGAGSGSILASGWPALARRPARPARAAGGLGNSGRVSPCAGARRRVQTVASSLPALAPPPTPPSTLPLLDDLLRVDLRHRFASHHALLNEAGQRVLLVRYLGKRVVLVRHPEDVAAVLVRRAEAFGKHPRLQRVSAWLGEGVATQPDLARHAAQRELLNPAFRPDAIRQLDGLLADAAARLADAVRHRASGDDGGGAGGRSAAGDAARCVGVGGASGGGGGGVVLEFGDVFKRHSLDVLGLTALRADFRSASQGPAGLRLAPAGAAAAAATAAAASLPSSAAADAAAPSAPTTSPATDGLVELLVQLESAAAWLLLQLPLPNDLLPGYRTYLANAAKLDELVYGMIHSRRREGVADGDRDLLAFMLRAQHAQQRQQQQGSGGEHASEAAPASCPHAAAAASAGVRIGVSSHESVEGSTNSTRCPVSHASPEEGAAAGGAGSSAVTDKQIRDEIVTAFFAGTDTTSHTLALTAYHLAACPEAQAAACEEVLEVLAGRPASALTSDDAKRLPFLAACFNETLRLYPGGTEVTRVALQDEAVGGYAVPRGYTVTVSLYSMHRSPDVWPQPDAWLPQRWLSQGWSRAYWPPAESAETLGPRMANAFLPFGVGARSCIGRSFALLNMQVTLAALLASVQLLPDPSGAPLQLVQSSALKSKNGVHLRVAPLRR